MTTPPHPVRGGGHGPVNLYIYYSSRGQGSSGEREENREVDREWETVGKAGGGVVC